MGRRKTPKTFSKYKLEYCEQLINHCELGYTINSFAAVIGVSQVTLSNWFERYPDFQHAKEMAMQRRSMKFQTDMINVCEGTTKANPTSFIFALKNCDPENFKDKIEMEHDVNVPIIIDTGFVQKALENKVRKVDVEVKGSPMIEEHDEEEEDIEEEEITEEDLKIF